MARVAVVTALVVCAAVLVAAAHAGRVLEYQHLDEAAPALAPRAAAVSPAPAQVGVEAADAGGDGVRGREGRESSGAIADVLWFVLQWANDAAAGDRRKTY